MLVTVKTYLRNVISLLWLIPCASACIVEDPPEDHPVPPDLDTSLVYESDRVEVHVEDGMLFCEGDGARMDAHIERLATMLAVEPPELIPVYVVRNDEGAAIADWCSSAEQTLGGCFQHGMIVSKRWAVPHELAHAVLTVVNPDARAASRFWFEAVASAFETKESTPQFEGLLDQEDWAAYDEADHLVRWLIDSHGIDATTQFYASLAPQWNRSEVDAAFEAAFSMSYEQAISDFQVSAPPIYSGYGWCDDVEIIEVSPGETQVALHVDCVATDTYAFAEPPIDGMYIRRVLRLTEASDLEIQYSTAVGILTRHPCLEEPVESADDPRLSGNAWYKHISSGVPSMGPLSISKGVPAGDNLVEFVVPHGEATDVVATILAEPASPG